MWFLITLYIAARFNKRQHFNGFLFWSSLLWKKCVKSSPCPSRCSSRTFNESNCTTESSSKPTQPDINDSKQNHRQIRTCLFLSGPGRSGGSDGTRVTRLSDPSRVLFSLLSCGFLTSNWTLLSYTFFCHLFFMCIFSLTIIIINFFLSFSLQASELGMLSIYYTYIFTSLVRTCSMTLAIKTHFKPTGGHRDFNCVHLYCIKTENFN